jgi:CheY-like chemotaxis protein
MAQRILIVDDDPDVGQLVALILQVAGYTGKCVISGPAALD